MDIFELWNFSGERRNLADSWSVSVLVCCLVLRTDDPSNTACSQGSPAAYALPLAGKPSSELTPHSQLIPHSGCSSAVLPKCIDETKILTSQCPGILLCLLPKSLDFPVCTWSPLLSVGVKLPPRVWSQAGLVIMAGCPWAGCLGLCLAPPSYLLCDLGQVSDLTTLELVSWAVKQS